jgi:acid phosphatase (class A)
MRTLPRCPASLHAALSLGILLLLATGTVAAGDQCVAAHSLDLRRILAPPPVAGSTEQRAELDQMLGIQAGRTPADVTRARADEDMSVFRLADALGSPASLSAERLPHTVALFQDLFAYERTVLDPAKNAFARPRPFTAEPRLDPVVGRPTSFSYPSGHALFGTAAGLVLADLVPERRAQILSRAREYAQDRVVGGAHYPSDVEAGRIAGSALVALLFDCTGFQAEEAAARAELRKALQLPLEARP